MIYQSGPLILPVETGSRNYRSLLQALDSGRRGNEVNYPLADDVEGLND